MVGSIILNIILFLIIRALYLIVCKKRPNTPLKKNARTLIIIGSGGHTSEMIRQVKKLNPTLYNPRLYIMADSDNSSEPKIKDAEKHLAKKSKSIFEIKKIPRSRKVNQSYLSSVFTTIYSTVKCIPVVLRHKPDLILCNGPGTCIPICFISFCMKVIFISETKIIFIESICRVKTLSLTGKILLYIADQVLVQWPLLHEKHQKTVFIGRLT